MPSPIAGPLPAAAPASAPIAAPKAAREGASASTAATEAADFSFADLLDVVNPLQHIPLIGTLYREITGDTIGTAAKIAGGGLFGGVVGLIAAAVDGIVEEATGKGTGEHLVAMLRSGNPVFGPEFEGGTDVALLDNAAPAGDAGAEAQIAAAAPATPLRQEAAPAPASARPNEARVLGELYQARNASQPQPLNSSVALTGVRGAGFTGLPAPQVLAANPELITAARGGDTVTAANAGWIRLMQATDGARTSTTGGLASATIAKAMASYGAAAR